MKINLTLIVLFVTIIFANKLPAQGVYFSINAGYGLKQATETMVSNYEEGSNFTGMNLTKTTTVKNVSLGEGFTFGGAFGYMFNKNFGLEMDVSYLIGADYKSAANYNYYNSSYQYSYIYEDKTYSARMLRFIPSIVFSANGRKNIKPYMKFGYVVGFGSVTYDYARHTSGPDVVDKGSSEKRVKYNEGNAFGLASSLGAQIKINKHFSLFGEVNIVSLSYAPLKGEITRWNVNGVDMMQGMSIGKKEIECVDTVSESGGVNLFAFGGNEELKKKYPMGSLGLNFGLKFSF